MCRTQTSFSSFNARRAASSLFFSKWTLVPQSPLQVSPGLAGLAFSAPCAPASQQAASSGAVITNKRFTTDLLLDLSLKDHHGGRRLPHRASHTTRRRPGGGRLLIGVC